MYIDEFKVKVGDVEYSVVPVKLGTKIQFSTDINGANHILQAKVAFDVLKTLTLINRVIRFIDVEKEFMDVLKSEIKGKIAKLLDKKIVDI